MTKVSNKRYVSKGDDSIDKIKLFFSKLDSTWGRILLIGAFVIAGYKVGRIHEEIIQLRKQNEMENKLNNMSKKNKIRRLSDVIVDIRKEINNNESQENKDAVRVLLDEANQIIDKNKKADKGIGYAMLLMFGVIIYFGVSLYQADNQISLLNDDIVEKRNTINNLQWSDSLFTKFMDLSYDSINGNRTIYYKSINGNPLTYSDLMKENDSLKNVNRHNELKLSLARRNYDISFKETDSYITIMAPKLDSALLLLPHYKNKIQYDANKKTWSVILP